MRVPWQPVQQRVTDYMDGNYLNAIKDYLPPNRNVASVGGICLHNKFSVSPDAPPALHASAHHGAPALLPHR